MKMAINRKGDYQSNVYRSEAKFQDVKAQNAKMKNIAGWSVFAAGLVVTLGTLGGEQL